MAESNMDIEDVLGILRTLVVGHLKLTPKSDEQLLLSKLQGLVTNIKWSPEDAAHLFKALLKRFESKKIKRSRLVSWMLEMLHCIEINYITPTWKCQQQRTLIKLVQDETVSDGELKKHLNYDMDKSLDEILEEIRQQKLNQIDEQLLEQVKDIVSSVYYALQNDKDIRDMGSSERGDLKEKLLLLCQTVKKIFKYTPRLTQLVSWCILVLSKTGRLVQVGTGEGKTCIVAMFAAYQAMRGKKVDIMSSSPVLAQRDMNEWAGFYKELKISINCNANKLEEDLKACYERQVVYGTVEEFAGDWLRHHFHRKDIFGKRKFECAVVDEVDSLMLDKGHHVVYLSTDMPALQHLNPLLAFIWATVNQYQKIGMGWTVGPQYPFYQVVLDKINNEKEVDQFTILQMAEDAGILAQGSVREFRKDMRLLTKKMAHVTANQLVKFFEIVERRFPSCQFDLHCMSEDGTKVNKRSDPETAETQRDVLFLINGGLCQFMYSTEDSVQRAVEAEIKRAVRFTPSDLSHDKRIVEIPGFLSDLVQSKLKVWIENAFVAQTMSTDHQYTLEEHGVVPVDYGCTGVVENQMKWTDGLQQFLEMKHGSKLSDMTAITNYMSNIGLLQKYGDQIFGVSGTLGKQAETETLQKIYSGIKTCQIPTFKRRKLFEVEGVIVDNEEQWIKKIIDVITTETSPTPLRSQRAVLVICETISRAKVLHRALGDQVPDKKLYISNNMDNKAIFAQALRAGEVIIATNLAGRGTDLKVSDSVKTAGGMFVVQTFLPSNARVEAQAFGRTARQGAPGSAQLIVCSRHLSETLQLLILSKKLEPRIKTLLDVTPPFQNHFLRLLRSYQSGHMVEQSQLMSQLLLLLSKYSDSGIKTVKKIRDDSVAQGLASFLESVIPEIKKKGELFMQYLETLDEVYRSSDNNPNESYLSALNEFWGMWLLVNVSADLSTMHLKQKLTADLKTARQKLEQRESPLSNLHYYTAAGNELRAKGQLAESIKMYTKAIEMDHCWAAVAYYNRAFASLSLQNSRQDPDCIERALQDLQNALKSVELYREQIKVTYRYAKQEAGLNPDCTRFDKHMKARKEVWLLFKANITEAMKMVERAIEDSGTVKVKETLVYFLVPLAQILRWVLLLPRSLSQIQSRDPLMMLRLISHPDFDIFSEVRCLDTLGLPLVYTLDTVFSLRGFFLKIHRKITRFFHWMSERIVSRSPSAKK